jgi:hypothetical protein
LERYRDVERCREYIKPKRAVDGDYGRSGYFYAREMVYSRVFHLPESP